jgi:hypothetical protein
MPGTTFASSSRLRSASTTNVDADVAQAHRLRDALRHLQDLLPVRHAQTDDRTNE